MMVRQSYRYELKPNNKQRTGLARHAGTARFAYNWGLDRRIREYRESGRSSNAIEQHRKLNTLKRTTLAWMYKVSKCAPQEALRDLDRALQNFYRGRKQGQKIGFPRFKRKGMHDAFRLTGSIGVHRKSVALPRIGPVRTKEETAVKGRVLSATVTREADRWFVSLTVERERERGLPGPDPAVGVDVGLLSFAVTSDGTRIQSPRPLEKALKVLKRRSRRHSRKRKGSANRKKSALSLARLHRKIRNKRRDFLHKVTTKLAKTKQAIVVEDLNVKGMIRNRKLSRSIADSGWGEFFRMLEYKTTWYGSTLLKAPAFYPSSKRCSVCGRVKENLVLSERCFRCEACGIRLDRDLNAAMNLEQLSRTASSAGCKACEDTSGSGMVQPGLEQSTSHVSMKQESDVKYYDVIFV